MLMNKELCSLEKFDEDGLHLVLGEMKCIIEAKELIHHCLNKCVDVHFCDKKKGLVWFLDDNVKEEQNK